MNKIGNGYSQTVTTSAAAAATATWRYQMVPVVHFLSFAVFLRVLCIPLVNLFLLIVKYIDRVLCVLCERNDVLMKLRIDWQNGISTLCIQWNDSVSHFKYAFAFAFCISSPLCVFRNCGLWIVCIVCDATVCNHCTMARISNYSTV